MVVRLSSDRSTSLNLRPAIPHRFSLVPYHIAHRGVCLHHACLFLAFIEPTSFTFHAGYLMVGRELAQLQLVIARPTKRYPSSIWSVEIALPTTSSFDHDAHPWLIPIRVAHRGACWHRTTPFLGVCSNKRSCCTLIRDAVMAGLSGSELT